MRSTNGIRRRNPETTLVSSGLSSPYGVAVDGSGNVYIADEYNDAVEVWMPATQTVTTLATVPSANGVAIDGLGNIYVSQNDGGELAEFPRAFVSTAPDQ